MGTEPLCDARAHHAGADDSGMHHSFPWRFRSSFLVFLSEKKIADQVLCHLGLAKIDNRVQLKRQRLLRGSKKAFLDHLQRACWSRIVIARRGNFPIKL